MNLNNRRLILGTRGSALALTQAEMVASALRQACPRLVVEQKIISTMGDRRTDVPLADVAKSEGVIDKGIFLKEIEEALSCGEIDFAVHSLKDMPSVLDEKFALSAVLPRASVEDVVISKSQEFLMCHSIATGSVRRRFMAARYWGDSVTFSDLRGNVPTRLSKLVANESIDAIILAKAGLERLGLFADSRLVDGTMVFMNTLPVSSFVPSAGQGIIGLEVRAEDQAVCQILSCINDEKTHVCARAERGFLGYLGANCSTPVGAHATLNGRGQLALRVLLFSELDNDRDPYSQVIIGKQDDPEGLARKMWDELKASGFLSMCHQA